MGRTRHDEYSEKIDSLYEKTILSRPLLCIAVINTVWVGNWLGLAPID